MKWFVIACLFLSALGGCSSMKQVSAVDYDLTAMNQDMVYSLVFQMMNTPEDYEGKTVKLCGLYYSGFNEALNDDSTFCVVKDAAACCAQGIEFITLDSIEVQDQSEITIQGIFESYEIDGSSYFRLKDANVLS